MATQNKRFYGFVSAAVMAASFYSLVMAAPSFADDVPAAVAAPVVPSFYLRTIAPGRELMSSFGHNSIEMDPDSDPQTPNSLVYEFGLPLMDRLLNRIMRDPSKIGDLIRLIVNESVPVLALYSSTTSYESIQVASYNAQNRAVTREALNLSTEEAIALKASLENEFSLIPGNPGGLRMTRAQKNYRSFDSNCATWIRDRLMAASPDLNALWNANAQEPMTLEPLLKSALDRAASAQRSGYVSWYTGNGSGQLEGFLTMMGLPSRIHSGAEFIGALDEMNTQLQSDESPLVGMMYVAGAEDSVVDLRPMFSAYVERIHRQQLSTVKDRIFLPITLRDALIAAGKISVN